MLSHEAVCCASRPSWLTSATCGGSIPAAYQRLALRAALAGARLNSTGAVDCRGKTPVRARAGGLAYAGAEAGWARSPGAGRGSLSERLQPARRSEPAAAVSSMHSSLPGVEADQKERK